MKRLQNANMPRKAAAIGRKPHITAPGFNAPASKISTVFSGDAADTETAATAYSATIPCLSTTCSYGERPWKQATVSVASVAKVGISTQGKDTRDTQFSFEFVT